MSGEAGADLAVLEQSVNNPQPAPQIEEPVAQAVGNDNSAQEAQDVSRLSEVREDIAEVQEPDQNKATLLSPATTPSEPLISSEDVKTEPQPPSLKSDSYIAELDVLSESERAEIFGPAVAAMYEIAQEQGITLPENLISKIHIVREKDFYPIIEKETGQVIYPDEWDVHGISLHKAGIALLNLESLSRISKATGIAEAEIIRGIGIHELWHTIDENGLLALSNYARTPLEKEAEEAGLPVHETGFSDGMSGVTEGFTEYRTREAMKRAGLPFRYSEYLGETEIIDKLVEKVGIESFYRLNADTGVEGMVSFSRSLDAVFGQDALKRLTYRMSYDYQTHGAPGLGRKRDFSGTKNYFINLDQVLANAA